MLDVYCDSPADLGTVSCELSSPNTCLYCLQRKRQVSLWQRRVSHWLGESVSWSRARSPWRNHCEPLRYQVHHVITCSNKSQATDEGVLLLYRNKALEKSFFLSQPKSLVLLLSLFSFYPVFLPWLCVTVWTLEGLNNEFWTNRSTARDVTCNKSYVLYFKCSER
jgi:hypothetical protein